MADAPEEPEQKTRRRPVVLFYIPGWPSQEPNRVMVWTVVYDGVEKAMRIVKRMRKRHRDIVWSLEMLSAGQVLRIRRKPFQFKPSKRESNPVEVS